MISSDPRRLLPLKFSSTLWTSLAIERKASEIVNNSSTRSKKKKDKLEHKFWTHAAIIIIIITITFPLSATSSFVKLLVNRSSLKASRDGEGAKDFFPPSSPVHSPSFLPFSFSFPPIDLAHSSRSEALTRAQRTLVNAALQDLTVTWRG